MTKRYTRFFAIPVNDDLVIEVEFGFTRGHAIPFVVRLVADLDGRRVCVSRFDSAHVEQPPHRDVIGLRGGVLAKEFYDGLDYGEAVKYVIEDFKVNGPDYDQDFLRH